MEKGRTIEKYQGGFILITPSVKYDENNIYFDSAYKIFLSNILIDDAKLISSNFKKMNTDVFTVVANKGKNKGLIIYVDSNKFDEFTNSKDYSFSDDSYYGQIYKFIIQNFRGQFKKKDGQIVETCYYRGNFNESENQETKSSSVSLKSLFEIILRLKVGTITSNDIKNRDAKIAHNWAEIANTLNDPKTRERLLRYQLSGTFKKKYGWNLSVENISYILAQKPDASFVLTASQWWDRYKRIVKPGAERIFMEQPSKNMHASQDEIMAASMDRGFNGSLHTGSQQVDHGNRISAESDKPLSGMYGKAVFDVSDTELANGATEDKWATEMGFVNQFTGELNDSALKDAEETDSIIKNEKEEQEKTEEQERLEIYINNAVSNLENYCKTNKIRYSESTSPNNNLSNLIYAVALKEAENVNIIKPTNQNHFANAIRYIVMAMIGAPFSKVSSYIHKTDWTDEDGSLLFSTYIKIKRIMNKENKEVVAVKENYNAILNRLNNVIF